MGNILGAFVRMHRALGRGVLTRVPGSPAQGLHRHGPGYFWMTCDTEKLGLVDQN